MILVEQVDYILVSMMFLVQCAVRRSSQRGLFKICTILMSKSPIQGFVSGAMLNVYLAHTNASFGQLVVLGKKPHSG